MSAVDAARPDRLTAALHAIDAANAADPRPWRFRDVERPKAAGEAELASEWVLRLRPDASEALLVATRAHHLFRWTIPRADYPEGRAGYLRWRAALKKVHAHAVGEILSDAGYDQDTIERVQSIVQKRDLAHDPEVQSFEDALCLVFVETQLDELAGRVGDDEKMVEVLRKTLPKMSEAGRDAALALVPSLPPESRRLLELAVSE